MFVRKKMLYQECARMIAKEHFHTSTGQVSQKVLTLRLLIYHLHGKEGLTELDTYVSEYKKITQG